MAIEVETKDCTALTDAEIAELADLCADGPHPHEVGFFSKQAEEWVLIAMARDDGRLKGFSFSTLERIGGTPAVLIGLAAVARNSKRDTVLRAIVHDLLHRALMAFPDEDVLVGAQFDDPAGFEAYKTLENIVPRPDHRANGEERAWGRRLAKRFGIDADRYDERAFRAQGDGNIPRVLDHESVRPERADPDVVAFFADLDRERGDSLIACGWAMAEALEKLG